MASILIPPQIQFIDKNGEPIVGGSVYTYEAGTDTPKISWKDQTETSPNENPIVLDDEGRAQIWIRGSYKIVVKNQYDVLIYTEDNVISYSDADFTGLTATIADLNTTGATAEIFYDDQSPTLSDRSKVFLIDATSENQIVNLPKISELTGASNKYRITVKKIDSSIQNVSVVADVSNKIDGANKYELWGYNDFVTVIADGSNWNVVATRKRGTIITVFNNFSVGLDEEDVMFNCDATSNNIELNLNPVANVGKGFTFSAKRIDTSSNSVIINAYTTELIDGKSQLAITSQNETYTIKCDGYNWQILSSFKPAALTTGDVKITIKPSEIGWIRIDDGTIGNAVSGATTRANEDTKDLYVLLYLIVPDIWCPVSGGRSGTTQTDAINDFNNGKTIVLPLSLGRAVCNYGNGAGLTSREMGEHTGLEDVSITVSQLPVHYHDYIKSYSDLSVGDLGSQKAHNRENTRQSTNAYNGSDTANNEAHPNMQPSIFLNFLIKL